VTWQLAAVFLAWLAFALLFLAYRQGVRVPRSMPWPFPRPQPGPFRPPHHDCPCEEAREAIAALGRQLTDLKHVVTRDSAALGAQLVTIRDQQEKLMSQQDDISQVAGAIEADVQALNDGVAAIQAEIAQLQAQNPALDLSGLQQAVADLGTATASVTAAGSEVPPPATP
jgi:hypothetical protein